jgi:nucleotide-binding universal stress UspA family protein
MQIKKILVPIDFSPLSRQALHCAVALARKCRATLLLLHVVESSRVPAFPPEETGVGRQHYIQSKRMLEALFATRGWSDLDIQTQVTFGKVEEQIISTARAANDGQIDLVVMGTHGRGAFERWLIGSVTDAVLQNAHIPVLTVGHLAHRFNVKRILFPTSLTSTSRDAADQALEFVNLMHSSLTAVHAVEVGVEGGAEAAEYLGEARVEEARARLAAIETAANQRSVSFDSIVAEGPAGDVILQNAVSTRADIIVVATPRDASEARNSVGSTAEEVIRHAEVPVLVIQAVSQAVSKTKPRAIREPDAA